MYPHALRAFASRDFRVVWTAAVVSSSGTQMQLAALGWVVALLTESATKVGLIAFAGVVPLVLLSPVGGSLADRFSRRQLLLVVQTLQLAQAVTLWVTWVAGVRSFWVLFLLAAFGGATTALAAPVWQSFIPSLVPRRDLQNAVMLNSTQFNIAKALGPVAAGLLLVNTAGAGWCFLINAVSFGAVLVALAIVGDAPLVRRDDGASKGFWHDFVEGVRYVRRDPGLRTAISVNSFVAFVGQPLVPLLPIVALEMFHASALEFGILAGSFGIGAILGAVLTGWLDGRRVPSGILGVGATVYAASIVLLAASPGFAAGVASVVGVGAGFLTVIATNNSAIQHLSSDEMRGRVVGIWLTTFGIFNPVGLLAQGVLADAVGIRAVLVADGILLLAFFAYVRVSRRLRTLDTDEALRNVVTPTPIAPDPASMQTP
jgi:MFS family permease